MPVADEKLVDSLAQLARLEFEGDEKKEIITDLNRMLDFVGKLKEVNTDHVEPLIYMTGEASSLREDVARTDITKKEALMNASEKDSDYFKVPKFIDKKA